MHTPLTAVSLSTALLQAHVCDSQARAERRPGARAGLCQRPPCLPHAQPASPLVRASLCPLPPSNISASLRPSLPPLLPQLDALQSVSATAKAETLAACPADEVVPEVTKADGNTNGDDATVELGCKTATGARITNRQVGTAGRRRPVRLNFPPAGSARQARHSLPAVPCRLSAHALPAGHAAQRPHRLHLQGLSGQPSMASCLPFLASRQACRPSGARRQH